jgi:hypothetical protein
VGDVVVRAVGAWGTVAAVGITVGAIRSRTQYTGPILPEFAFIQIAGYRSEEEMFVATLAPITVSLFRTDWTFPSVSRPIT